MSFSFFFLAWGGGSRLPKTNASSFSDEMLQENSQIQKYLRLLIFGTVEQFCIQLKSHLLVKTAVLILEKRVFTL